MATWSTVELDLDPLLEPIQPILAAIDSVLALIIAILNIINAILNVIKAFLLGLLDPIRPIIEAIINEIRQFIHDLRQLGVYITGDWDLVKPPFTDIQGGYAAFERRMLARLVDTRDPGRPDWSTSSAAMGAFFYASSGDIWIIIKLIQMIKKFFGQDWALSGGAFPVPTTPTVKFTETELWEGKFGKMFKPGNLEVAPKGLCVEWQMPPPAPGNPLGLFGPAPDGFLIHVSTVKDGLRVMGVQPKDGSTKQVENLPTTVAAGIDPWNNAGARLYGGICDLSPGSGQQNKAAFQKICDTSNQQAGKVFLIQDENTPWIPTAELYPKAEGSSEDPIGEYLVGRTFFAPAPASKILGPGAKYQAIIPQEMLPLKVDWVAGGDGFATPSAVHAPGPQNSSFTVRVRALGFDNSEDSKPEDWPNCLFNAAEDMTPYPNLRKPLPLGPGGTPIGKTFSGGPYVYNKSTVRNAQTGVMKSELPFGSLGLAGAASPPCSVEYPSETQIKFIKRVQAALALGILLRCDYTSPPATPTSISDAGKKPYDQSITAFPKGSVNVPLTENGDFESTVLGILRATGGLNAVQIDAMYRTKNPMGFRRKVRRLCYLVATEMSKGFQLPDSVTQPILDETEDLETWPLVEDTYGAGLTLLQSFGLASSDPWGPDNAGKDEQKGVGANPLCRNGIPGRELKNQMMANKALALRARPNNASGFNIDNDLWENEASPGAKISAGSSMELSPVQTAKHQAYLEAQSKLKMGGFIMGQGTADWTPTLFNNYENEDGGFVYIRDLVRTSKPDLITKAQMVLNAASSALTRPVPDSQWIAIRLMPNALAGADEILDAIEKFLYGILDMLQGLIDRIIAFIEGIQARIYQLQALIEWIRSLLRSLELFAIGPFGGLVVVGSGTSGIMSEFMMAENKPGDGAGAYAAGVLVAAGGIPLFLLELLALIMGKEE